MLSQFISKNRLTNVSGIVWFLQLYNLSLQMILIENKIIQLQLYLLIYEGNTVYAAPLLTMVLWQLFTLILFL